MSRYSYNLEKYFLSKWRLVEEENEVENEDDSFSTEDDSFTTQVVTDYSASYSASSNELTIGDSLTIRLIMNVWLVIVLLFVNNNNWTVNGLSMTR